MDMPTRSSRMQRALAEGTIRIDDPAPLGDGRYAVRITEVATGEHVEKVFGNRANAQQWVTTQALGGAEPVVRSYAVPGRTGCAALDDDEDVPIAVALARAGATVVSPTYERAETPQAGTQRGGVAKTTLRVGKVREVLERYGLDPTEEIVKVLRKVEPVRARDGSPVLDEKGAPVYAPVVDDKTALTVLADLQQYVAPKLKAIEVVQRDERPRSVDEIDAAILKLAERREAVAAGAVR